MSISGVSLQELSEVEKSENDLSLLQVSCGDLQLGFPLIQVQKIIPLPLITRLASLPPFIRGVSNLRGEIFAVLDLQTFFLGDKTKASSLNRLVIIESGDVNFAALVFDVIGIVSVPRDKIQSVPKSFTGIDSSFLKGIYLLKHHTLLLINPEAIFNDSRVEALRRSNEDDDI